MPPPDAPEVNVLRIDLGVNADEPNCGRRRVRVETRTPQPLTVLVVEILVAK
jgi:hypothetical protein